MPKVDRDTLVSVDDAGDVAKKEYESYIKQQEQEKLFFVGGQVF